MPCRRVLACSKMESASNETRAANGITLQDLKNTNGNSAPATLDPSSLSPSAPTRAYYFGCGPCHPRRMQVLADPKVYTFLLSLFVIVEGAVVSGESEIGACSFVCNRQVYATII